jgi:NAD(P)-dependent dehydrogenase (short-subunit alcohol dehydrogenase family)
MKTAIVTGAASGIGLATTRALIQAGYQVHAVDRAEDGLSRESTNHASSSFIPHVGDVSDEQLWSSLSAAVDGRVDVLVHNAFTLSLAPLHLQTKDDWTRQWEVMVGAVFYSVAHLHDALLSASGSMVLVSSVHSRIGVPGHPAYAAAKGALNALARQLAVEYGPGIRVNSVIPGPIRTPVWDSASKEELAQVARQTPLGRLGDPDEVARVICFLGSTDSSYIHGAEIVVDGGWSIAKDSR